MTTGKLTEPYHVTYCNKPATFCDCVDCKTSYIQLPDKDGVIKTSCNGHFIELCPWCRPDSTPWAYGRGA